MTPSAPQQIVMPQMPTATAQAPVFSPAAVDTRTQRKSTTPTFLGAAAMPSQQNAGWKTLIGQ